MSFFLLRPRDLQISLPFSVLCTFSASGDSMTRGMRTLFSNNLRIASHGGRSQRSARGLAHIATITPAR